jgi:hypothetical protein
MLKVTSVFSQLLHHFPRTELSHLMEMIFFAIWLSLV